MSDKVVYPFDDMAAFQRQVTGLAGGYGDVGDQLAKCAGNSTGAFGTSDGGRKLASAVAAAFNAGAIQMHTGDTLMRSTGDAVGRAAEAMRTADSNSRAGITGAGGRLSG